MVMVPNGVGEYPGIGLVEAVWKVVMVIINCPFTASIDFYYILCGFWVGHGTYTTYLKAKLIEQLTAMREEVLYPIILDLHKAYDDLESNLCLKILEV